ncbi:MAG: Spy/CpxP family protein refolding chaperone [Verrucomicrobiales bacterium]
MNIKPILTISILALANTLAFGQADAAKSDTPAKGSAFKVNPGIRTNLTNTRPILSRQPDTAPRPAGLSEAISPDQRAKLTEANSSMQKEVQPLYLQMRQVRQELDQLVSTNNFDESAIRSKAAQLGKLEGDLAIARAKHQKTIRGFLTTNQANVFQPPTLTNTSAKRLQSVVERQGTTPAPKPSSSATPVPNPNQK